MSDQVESSVNELLPLFALGELDGNDFARVEKALAEDVALQQELEAWQRDLGNILAESVEPLNLESAEMEQLERKLLSALGNATDSENAASTPTPLAAPAALNRSSSEPSTAGWMLPMALAASVLALAVAFWAVGGRASRSDLEQLRIEKAVLSAEVADLRNVLDRNSEEIARVSTSLQTFGYPRSEPIVLAGLQEAPDATGAAFYRPSSGEALFFAYGLPGIDASAVYQLWYITDDGPVSAGTFDTDASGEARVLVANVPEQGLIAAWAVTREPAGGSVQPTGPMLIKS